MPRWLRQFTFNQINNFYKKEAEEYENKMAQSKKPNQSTLIDPSGKINKAAWKDVQKQTVTSGPSKVKYNK